MSSEGYTRKLAAILYSDVAGYSRLTGADEVGTHRRLSEYLDRIAGLIAQHNGRVVHYAGDAVLADFGTVSSALHCAAEIQRDLASRNADLPAERKVQFRIGVNLGEVIVDRNDIYGDGVNIAARLESLAEPGGICISESVRAAVGEQLPYTYEFLGEQRVKNIALPVRVYRVLLEAAKPSAHPPESSLVDAPADTPKNSDVRPSPAATSESVSAGGSLPLNRPALSQTIRFCTSPDGVRLAYAVVGQGPVLVKAANWLSHLEYDWNSPVWRHWLTGLASSRTLVRYDERGCGLSDWNVADFSLDAWVLDLETVVDALGLARFPLLGISHGAAIAIAYTVRHPEKVSRLILYGGYARGRLHRELTPSQREEREVMLQLIKVGWGKEHPAFRQVFSMLFLPEGTPEQIHAFNELERISTTPEIAARIISGFQTIDVRALAKQVTQPTLVLHAKDDLRAPFEEGRLLAALIPNARLVPLESKNHILLAGEPAWQRFLDEVNAFLAE